MRLWVIPNNSKLCELCESLRQRPYRHFSFLFNIASHIYQIIQNMQGMQGIYATSTFLDSTCFSLFNPFYCDSKMVLPNNHTAKSTQASVLAGPMNPNEQQAFLLVNTIRVIMR